MKNHVKVLATVSFALATGAAFSAIPNEYQPKTSLGPYLHVGYANLITPAFDYAISAEGIAEHQRLGGGVGYQVDPNQRVKVTAEYLRQNIGYSYFSANSYQWTFQTDINARYQYNFFDTRFSPSVDFAGYFSSVPSKTLRLATGSFLFDGAPATFASQRRLAGSSNSGALASLGVKLWKGNEVAVDLNYDNIIYDVEYESTLNPQGVGGAVHINQIIQNALSVGGSASWRTPYNIYAFNLGLVNIRYSGNWTLGVEGTYVRGKNTLPNTYNIGMVVNFMPDLCGEKSATARNEAESLMNWTSKPAVYNPQVLAVADEFTTITLVSS